jgi:hypothetical protein
MHQLNGMPLSDKYFFLLQCLVWSGFVPLIQRVLRLIFKVITVTCTLSGMLWGDRY